MTKAENTYFAGLPVALVEEMLAKSVQIGNEIYESLCKISADREKLREQLLEKNMIKNDTYNDTYKEEIVTTSTCGVDGCYTIEKCISADLVCCAAFAAEGSIPPSGVRLWETPVYKTMIHTEELNAETAGILRAIMMEMEIELAAGAPHGIILLNGSYITPFVTLMETLKKALETKASTASQEFISRIKTFIQSYKTIFNSGNTNQIWAGVPKNVSKQELVSTLHLPDHYDNKTFLTILLSPGEYTAPLPVDKSEILRVNSIPIKDEKFAAVRDNLVSFLSNLCFIYYRPYEWMPAIRIEITEAAAQNDSQFALLLNSIKFQCCNAVLKEPYPIYHASTLAHKMKSAIASLRRLSTSSITNLPMNNKSDILQLLLLNDSYTGD